MTDIHDWQTRAATICGPDEEVEVTINHGSGGLNITLSETWDDVLYERTALFLTFKQARLLRRLLTTEPVSVFVGKDQ